MNAAKKTPAKTATVAYATAAIEESDSGTPTPTLRFTIATPSNLPPNATKACALRLQAEVEEAVGALGHDRYHGWSTNIDCRDEQHGPGGVASRYALWLEGMTEDHDSPERLSRALAALKLIADRFA